MEQTIGKIVGITDDAFDVTNARDQKAHLNVKIDYRNATDQQVREWLNGNRRIAGQRVWRALSRNELLTIVNGKTFDACTIGHKIKSRQEQIDDYVGRGYDAEVATFAVDHPAEFMEHMNAVKTILRKNPDNIK